MTFEQIEQYNRELGAGIENLGSYDKRLAQIRMFITMAEANDDTEKALEGAKGFVDSTAERDLALKVLLTKTGTTSFETFRRFVMDLGIKIEAAARVLEMERRLMVQHEMMATMGQYSEPQQRVDAEAKIAEATYTFETQLSLAAAMIPSKPMLLSASGGASI